MGRHNHENSLALKGYGHPVVLSGDDSFVTSPDSVADVLVHPPTAGPTSGTTRAICGRFVSDDPAYNDYYDFVPGSTHSVSGHFIQVPKNIATGKNNDGRT